MADSSSPDLDDPSQVLEAVRDASLRLLAGAVPRATIHQLQKLARENVGDFPWQEATRRILAEPVDEQKLVQQGLSAQRDWIWRGGRETPGPSLQHRTKGFFAKICAQTIFLSIWAAVLLLALLILKYQFPGFDIYRVLTWLGEIFPAMRR